MADFAYHTLEILQAERMTETVRKMIPVDKKATTEIFTGRWQQWEAVAKWDEISFTRETAPLAAHAAPATNLDLLPRIQRTAAPAHIFLKKSLDRDTLTRLRRMGTTNVRGAQEIVADELRDMRSYIDHTVEYSCWQALTPTGWVVDQTAGAYTSGINMLYFAITYPVTVLTTTDLGDWDIAGAGILGESPAHGLNALRESQLDVFGELCTDLYCNNTVPTFLYKNTDLVQYFSSDAWKDFMRARSGERGIPLREYTFLPYDKGYKPRGGSYTKFLADDVFIAINSDASWRRQFMGLIELSGAIPNKARTGLQDVSPGIYAYSDVGVDPPSVDFYMGYYWLPVIKWPEAIFHCTVS